MEKLAAMTIMAFPEDSGIGRAIVMLKEDCLRHSKQSLNYCNEIKAEILGPLYESLEKQSEVCKDIKKKLKEDKIEFEKEKEELEKMRVIYHSSVTNLDNGISEYESIVKAKEIPEEKRMKYVVKVNQLLKECNDIEREYRTSVYEVKDTRVNHIRTTKELLNTCQDIEEQRVELIKKAILGVIKKEEELISFKNINLKDSREIANKIEIEQEVQTVIKSLNPQIKIVEDVIFDKKISKFEKVLEKFNEYHVKGDYTVPFNYEAVKRTILSENDNKKVTKPQAITNTLSEILYHCWNGKELTLTELNSFRDIIKNKEYRHLFCNCLNNYRKEGMFCLTDKAFSHVVKLLNEILTQIEAEQDIDGALLIIVLSQTFYYEDRTNAIPSKIYLQQGIASNKLFKSREFWVEALKQPLAFEQVNSLGKETLEEKKFRNENEVFVKLGTYSHNMLQFGLSKDLVEEITFAYARERLLSKEYMDIIQQSIDASVELGKKVPNEQLNEWVDSRKKPIEEMEKKEINKEELLKSSGELSEVNTLLSNTAETENVEANNKQI